LGYLELAEAAPVLRRSWDYPDFASYGAMSYYKPSLILKTVESLEGTEAVDRLLRAFFERARFRHPTTEEFLETVREVMGPGIEALVSKLLRGTDTLDFEVLAVANPGKEPFRGYDLSKTPPELAPESADGPTAAAPGQSAEAWIGCSGGIALPVTVRMTFSDGSVREETWDGTGSPKVFRYAGRRLAKVEVDPEARLPLERVRLNNGWQEDADADPAHHLAARAVWVLEALFSAFLAAF
jgi:hypothetical protein